MSDVDWATIDAASQGRLDPNELSVAIERGVSVGSMRFRRRLAIWWVLVAGAVLALTVSCFIARDALHGPSAASPSRASGSAVPPVVTGVSPDSGNDTGGTTVTITGTALTDASAVTFGSANATDVQVVSDTQITATTPPGSGTVDVTVTTPAGISQTGPPKARYTYEFSEP